MSDLQTHAGVDGQQAGCLRASHFRRASAEHVDLTAGQSVPTPAITLSIRLQQPSGWQADLVALLLDDQGQVSADADFVFYNAARHPSGAVTLDGPLLSVDLSAIPPTAERVVIAADRDGGGNLDGVAVSVEGAEPVTFLPAGLSGLPTAVLLEVFRRGDGWRVRAVGQGWASGLAGLARDYGVNVEPEGGGDGAAPPQPGAPAVPSPNNAPLEARDAAVDHISGLRRALQQARCRPVHGRRQQQRGQRPWRVLQRDPEARTPPGRRGLARRAVLPPHTLPLVHPLQHPPPPLLVRTTAPEHLRGAVRDCRPASRLTTKCMSAIKGQGPRSWPSLRSRA